MRNYTVICLLLFCFVGKTIQAQDTTPGEWITVNLDMTDSMTTKNLGFDVTSKLATKVLRIVSKNGKGPRISCVRNKVSDPSKIDLGDLNTGILCKPKLEIFDEEMVDTGMEKLTVVTISLSIFIQSAQGNIIFASTNKEYQGSGKNKQAAINNAITGIKVKDKLYMDFLDESRTAIVEHYDQMCGAILEQANTLRAFKKFREAIFLLWPIPYEAKCHKETRDTMISVYRALVEYKCDNYLFDAKTYVTQKDYGKAMHTLRNIDAQASCAPEALALMSEISTKVDEQERQYIDLYKKMRENDFELEKERYRSMGKISKSVNLTKVEIEK